MDEPDQKNGKNGRITEEAASRSVVVTLPSSKVAPADGDRRPDSLPADCFVDVSLVVCSRTKRSDALEPEPSSPRARYLGCLTKGQLVVASVCAGLLVLLLVSAVTAVVLTRKPGTCSNVLK